MADPLPEDFLKGFYDKSVAVKPKPQDESELISSLHKIKQRYLDQQDVGSGGMKVIQSYEDSLSGRRIAQATIKNCESAAEIDNFIREARLTAMLEHPNIVPLYDIGLNDQGLPFFTMKLLGGRNLEEILDSLASGNQQDLENFNLDYRLEIFLKVCDALSYAHSKGVVHLDIKPANIQINEFGEVLLCDWGLARELDGRGACETLDIHKDDLESFDEAQVPVSMDKTIKGTPGFMAPEQVDASAGSRNIKTDVYSLGSLLYALLTFEAPYSREAKVKDVLAKTLLGDAEEPIKLKPDLRIPRALNSVVLKAMSVEQFARYATPAKLAEEIRAWSRGFATRAEDAGFVRNIILVFKRHKTIAFYTALFLMTSMIILSMAFQRVNEEKNRAQESEISEKHARQRAEDSEEKLSIAFHELEEEQKQRLEISKQAAENFLETALNAIRNEQYSKALTMINDILSLNPTHQKALIEKGRLMIGQLRFHEALISFELLDKPGQVQELIDLCMKYRVLKEKTGRLTIEQVFNVITELKKAPLNLNWHLQGMIKRWVAFQYPFEERVEFARQVIAGNEKHKFDFKKLGDHYELDVSDHPGLKDISVLTKLPLTKLNLSHTSVRELSPLKEMQLDELNISHTFVSELGALKKMTLIEIDLRNSHVTKLNDLNVSRMKRIYLNKFVMNIQTLFDAPVLEEVHLPHSFQNKKHLRQLSKSVKIIRY